MSVTYDSKKLIPGPFISLRKSTTTTEGGVKIGTAFNVVAEGKIVVDKGSPNSSGQFWTLGGYPPDETLTVDNWLTVIIRKQEALRQLFATPGLSFEVQGYDGMAPMKFNPRKIELDFRRGQNTSWTNTCDYSINMETDLVYLNNQLLGEDTDIIGYYVQRAEEVWNIEPTDEFQRTFRLTHQLSAQGKAFYDDMGNLFRPAWENARDYVFNKIGLGIDQSKMYASGVLNAAGLIGYNYSRTQNVNELGGGFAVTETWLGFDPAGSGAAVEDYDIDVRTGNDRLTTVSIKGTIKGLDLRNSNYQIVDSGRYNNAIAKYNTIKNLMYARCSNVVPTIILNPILVEESVGINENNGIITYNRTYNDRPLNVVAGSLSEHLNISYDNANDVFAVIPIVGRAAGPIIQDMETITETKVNISVEIAMPVNTTTYTNTSTVLNSIIRPAVATVILANKPVASTVKVAADKENFIPTQGRYSRQVSYIYQ